MEVSKRFQLRLTATAARAIDIARCIGGTICCELHVDARQFCGLTGAAKRIALAEVNEMILRRAA